jgi:phosphatidylglycerol:prolipoprotein diacylglycerol transferase
MQPVLFKIGSFPVHSYGVMFAVAFLIATYIAARRAEKEGIPSQTIFSLGLLLMVSAIVGARVFHILQHTRSYGFLTNIAEIWESGLSGLAFYGGFILALVVGSVYIRWGGLSVAGVMDILAPSLMLGTGIGRVGCFLAGCCFGKPTSLPWGVTFPESSMVTLELGRMEKIHPTQLYSFVSLLVIFFILLVLRKHMKIKGMLFLVSILMYSVHRFFIDLLRYYTPDERMGSLATSQVMSIIAAIVSIAIMIFLNTRQTPDVITVEARKSESAEELS